MRILFVGENCERQWIKHLSIREKVVPKSDCTNIISLK